MALADVQAILIKATYTTNSQEVALSSVSLDTAEARNTGNPLRAHEVEHCECPQGYTGLSCHDCEYGYKRAEGGLYLGLCTKCDCNGWSNECDPESGICFNCNGHRTGSYCEECIQGYNMNEFGQCQPGSNQCICDPRGSISPTCYDGYCQCKQNVEGQTCNRCREGTFGLNANLSIGCQSCFCSGVSRDCSESNLYIEQLPSEIYSDASNFTLTDQYSRNRITTGLQTNSEINEIGYFFRPSKQERLFWSLPSKFTGNRITSYGGKLEYTQRYTQRPSASYILDQDILISGNGITISWTNHKQQQPDIANRVSVALIPASNWQRQDSQQGPRPASREDIMRVLASVDSILIRAQLSSDTSSSFISDITLDTAVTTYTPNRAVNVEVCRCPPGYKGTSCETCDTGYYRDINDIQVGPFGSCTRCTCNNHETNCELVNGVVTCNCAAGWTGRECERIEIETTTADPGPPTRPPITIEVIITEPIIKIANVGGTVQYHCQARTTTQNAVVIYWSKDGGPLPERAIDDRRGLLIITDLRVSDSGTYSCQASDGISSVSQHVSLTVGGNRPETPTAVIYPTNVDINEGESFELRCAVTGNPYPDIHWERENSEPFNTRHSIISGQLRILSATSSDSGRYICSATNTAGSSVAYVYVLVRPYSVVEPIIRPASYSGDEGVTFTLSCETKEQILSIRWEKEDGSLPYYHRTVSGVLTVTNPRTEDSGNYVCHVTSVSGQPGNKSARVVIHPPDSGTDVYPSVHIHPKNQTVNQGTNVEIHCDATGSPAPTIKWTRVHDDFGPNTRQDGPILRIDKIDIDDRGIYVCVASNIHGIAQDSSVLNVERRERPEVQIYPDATQSLNEGDDVQVICRIIAGIPQPFLTWSRRDGKPVSHQIQQGNELIRITGIKREDAGDYVCTASNDFGTASATTSIVVYVPPTIILSHVSPLTVTEGQFVRLECRSTGYPLPTVQWRKHGAQQFVSYSADSVKPISNQAVLEIHNIGASDEGTYICQATNSGGHREEYIQLVVDSFPSRGDITGNGTQRGEDAGSDSDNYPAQPDLKNKEPYFSAAVNTRAELRCRVADDRYPIQIKWLRQDNISLPLSAQFYENILYIDNVQPSDAGKYICLGIDNAGRERFSLTVNFVVLSPPRVTLQPSRQIVPPYGHATIRCTATGDAPIEIQWHAIGRDMPRSVYVSGGTLEFRGIEVSDAGRYRCTARNTAGEADSVAEVLVEADNKPPPPAIPEITITPTSQEVKYGDHLDLECRSNEHGVILTWSKVGERLADNVVNYGTLLRFTSVTTENNGRYRCETKGPSGYYYRDYTVDVIETVQEPTAPPLDIQYAPQGETIYMDCKTDLEEPVNYQWSKQNGELSEDVDVYSKQLLIKDLTSDDAGSYVCSASNGRQSVNNPIVLVVTGIVPYFTQAPNSYLALPTIPDHYARLNFEISFKPENDNGLILYNGNNKRKDFVSLAITGGYIEFKYNLGHDTTTLVSNEPVQLGKWHTVKVRRDRKTGIMYVDGNGPVTVTGKGKYSGLTLTDPLYLGGVPVYNDIPSDIDIKSGFVGCISQLKVGHNYYDLLKEASVKTGVTTCETCQENPCQNQGVCQESLSKEGFTCICTEGFSGPTCNKVASQSCTPYICGVGRCIDNDDSYECHCPLGRVGTHCEYEVSIYEPGFTKDAYVAYPPLKNTRRLRINLKIKPRDLSDGILLYSAQDPEGHGNFVSLAIKDKRVEFRYDVGNGPVIVRNDKDLEADDYISIIAMKSASDGKLMVGDGNMIVEKQIGVTQPLSLHTPLYLGGISKTEITVNPGVGVTSGFNGCISEFGVVGVQLNIIKSATSSANVLDCSSLNSDNNEISNELNSETHYIHGVNGNGCSSNPCWNDGKCNPLKSSHYECSCVNGYTGQYCEIAPNQCDQLQPCHNGGTCEGTTTGYRCTCPIEFQGTNCEQRQYIGNEVHFEGNGYLEFDKKLLSHNVEHKEEMIALQLSTNASNGLVFWQGQGPSEDGKDRDHIALAVVDGYLLFTFNAGSGSVDILNDRVRIDDGKRHIVVLKRRANYGSIEIDNEYLEKGEGIYRRGIDIRGNIYLGGTPNISLMTGRFSQGFVGCIHGFELQDSPTLELGTKAISGINVKPCSSFKEEDIVY